MTKGVFVDLTGGVYGRWTVLRRVSALSATKRESRWLCKCECGIERAVGQWNLTRGQSRSCGCYSREMMAKHCREVGYANRRYSDEKRTVARIYYGIKDRCFNKKAVAYKRYGAVGISMAPEWRDNFDAFYAEVGDRPSSGHSIDRINPYLGYIPGNVRWATDGEQQRNLRIHWLEKENEILKSSLVGSYPNPHPIVGYLL